MTKTNARIFLIVCLAILVVACGHGKGISPEGADHGDYDTALKELRPLAEQGHASAQVSLGVMYNKGLGVPQDYQEAARWYRLAGDQGNAYAQNNLGYMYNHGQGVPQDYQEALRWYRLAGDQGNAYAQNNLGYMYNHGQGAPRNSIQAYMWASLAAAQGDEEAAKGLEILEKEMTPPQLAEAQRLVREWNPKGGQAEGVFSPMSD